MKLETILLVCAFNLCAVFNFCEEDVPTKNYSIEIFVSCIKICQYYVFYLKLYLKDCYQNQRNRNLVYQKSPFLFYRSTVQSSRVLKKGNIIFLEI